MAMASRRGGGRLRRSTAMAMAWTGTPSSLASATPSYKKSCWNRAHTSINPTIAFPAFNYLFCSTKVPTKGGFMNPYRALRSTLPGFGDDHSKGLTIWVGLFWLFCCLPSWNHSGLGSRVGVAMAVRRTVGKCPADTDAQEACGIPWGATVSPFAAFDETGQSPKMGKHGHELPRCDSCWAYLNMLCEVDKWAWTCGMCGNVIALSEEHMKRYQSSQPQPELSSTFIDLEIEGESKKRSDWSGSSCNVSISRGVHFQYVVLIIWIPYNLQTVVSCMLSIIISAVSRSSNVCVSWRAVIDFKRPRN